MASVTAHQLHKLPPTERKGNLWEKPRESRFLPSPCRKGRKSVSRHVSSERGYYQPRLPCSRNVAQAFALNKDREKALKDRFCSISFPSTAPEGAKTTRKPKPKTQVVSFPEKPPEELGCGNATGNQGRHTLQIAMVATRR